MISGHEGLNEKEKAEVLSEMKRDEFTCCCCGTSTEDTCCDACTAFECGERAAEAVDRDGCLVPKGITIHRARHAAHYAYAGGHDLLIVETTSTQNERPKGLPSDFEYHSGSRINGVQKWRYTRSVPLSPGTCERCPMTLFTTGERR